MAEELFTVFMPVDHNGNNIPNCIGVQWTGLGQGDTGKPFVCGHRSVKSVQVKGTFSGVAICNIQGTNDQAYNTVGGALSPTWAALSDPQGNALAMGTASIEQVQENPNAIRPSIGAGDGSTDITCTMILTGGDQ